MNDDHGNDHNHYDTNIMGIIISMDEINKLWRDIYIIDNFENANISYLDMFPYDERICYAKLNFTSTSINNQ